MTKIGIGEPRPTPVIREYGVLPCPFCGGEPKLEFDYADNMPCGVRLRCDDCSAGFYEVCFKGNMPRFKLADMVIAKWNKRVNIDSK